MNWKTVLGLILVAASAAGMYFWETEGRSRVTLVSTVVCAEDLEKGQIITSDDISVVRMLPESLISGGLNTENIGAYMGMETTRNIPRGQQFDPEDFRTVNSGPGENEHRFVIPDSWIFSRSNALEEGTRISVYLMPEKCLLGNYAAAYVDEDRVEVYCSIEEYYGINDSVELCGPECLLLVEEDLNNG